MRQSSALSIVGGLVLVVCLGSRLSAQDSARPPTVNFISDIQPILRDRCYECHGSDNEESGLNLARRGRAFAGGESGPAIVPGDSKRSLLIRLVSGNDPERLMPPEGKQLGSAQIALLRAWIDQGAEWPDNADVLDTKLERARLHWAFRPRHSIDVPPAATAWAITPIDQFIERAHLSNGLKPTEAIDPRRLVRRIYFGIVGLPPTTQAVSDFTQAAHSDRAAAIDDLLDRLLASSHYGERWARHWLDVARYADSDGQEADRDRPNAYRYRDFVIRSFNDDLPFDQFVRWQIAGDELAPENSDAVIATGFLTAGTDTVLEDSFLEEERLRNLYNELDDVVSTLGSAMLGLTVGCARCHDHKFDAISSREYYQLLCAFHSGDRHTGKLPDGTEGLFFRDASCDPRTTWLFERGDFYDRDEEVTLGFPAVLMHGAVSSDEWTQAGRSPLGESTGQRRALAEWITDVDKGAGALLARVIVNRIWQHHFGQGLVRTTSDFGVRGDMPSHPDLLEWLVDDFIAHGWRIKRLQRMMIRSAVYQQDGHMDPVKHAIDPANRLLWRMTPQRLEAEILRDAILAVSGTINLRPFGPGFKPFIPAEAVLARNLKDGGYPANAQDTPETRRRSIYMFHKRLVPYPMFQAFDRPDLLQSCARRDNTIVAPQALVLLNDPFVRLRAEDFAGLLLSRSDGNDESLVRMAFQRSLGREPSRSELSSSTEFLVAQGRRRKQENEENYRHAAVSDFCQLVFGLNEFLYVD